MRGSTVLVVGVTGVVVVAAVVSSFRGGGDSSGAPAATTAAATTPTLTTPALPVGDVRRLPPVTPGAYPGRLFAFTSNLCVVVVTDLTTFRVTNPGGVGNACTIWPSPGNVALASQEPPPDDAAVRVAPVFDGRSDDTGLRYVPGNAPGGLSVADNGDVAACYGTSVRLSHEGRVQTVRAFTPVDGQFDERCVTGAIGRRIVQLGDDRTSLVDVTTHRVVRRLAAAVRSPVVAIASSPDGLVLIADLADGPPQGTVFGRSGKVLYPRTPIARGVAIRKLVLSRDGIAAAVQSSRGWDVTNLQSHKTLIAPGRARVDDVAFSPDGDTVALATENGVVFAQVADLTPRTVLTQSYQALAWLPDT
jgi:hypothetical protein